MFIQPWQIFLGGCICGAFITVIVIIAIILKIATHHGVRVEHRMIEQEEEDENG